MDKNIHDVEFKHVDENSNSIRGKALYYSTSQVATLLSEADSKIRYYTSVFDNILKIQISNKQRRYTDQDIQKLKFIIELKNSGMTIKQIQEYCENVDFDNKNGIQIKETNPLSIQTLAKALLEEQQKQMLIFKEELANKIILELKKQIEDIKNNNESLKNTMIQEVSITVDEIVTERVNTELSTFKNYLDEKQESTLQSQKENFDYFTNQFNGMIEEQKELQQKQTSDFNDAVQEFLKTNTRMEKRDKIKEKSFWSKLFKKD